jgi:hypothetical protein
MEGRRDGGMDGDTGMGGPEGRNRKGGKLQKRIFSHPPPGHEKKSTPRKVFETMHPNLGRLIMLLAIITIFAGISEAEWHWWVYIFYGSCLGILLVVCILLEVLSRTSDKVERV